MLQTAALCLCQRVKAYTIVFYGKTYQVFAEVYLYHNMAGACMFQDVLDQLLGNTVQGQLDVLVQLLKIAMLLYIDDQSRIGLEKLAILADRFRQTVAQQYIGH